MINFTSPEWLLLVPLAILAGWYWRQLQLTRPPRFVCKGCGDEMWSRTMYVNLPVCTKRE